MYVPIAADFPISDKTTIPIFDDDTYIDLRICSININIIVLKMTLYLNNLIVEFN